MPPSHHSHSSHSSHSHSSSRSHSHSHSSHSSSYTSRSGSYVDRSKPYIGVENFTRQRFNQPTGFKDYSRVTGYKCRKHEYIHYPIDWTDNATGASYKHGFYDESGNRYEQLILKHNQSYENVPLRCEYCGNTTVRDLTDDTLDMRCDGCGAVMVIDAILDEPDETKSVNNLIKPNTRPVNILFIIFVVMFFASCCCFNSVGKMADENTVRNLYVEDVDDKTQSVSNVDIFGDRLYVSCSGNEYDIIETDGYFDKTLYWDYGYESYYDKDTDCYVWYNTDVAPNLWQYWYEGISSDYDDYGWMEYEDGTWYIETSEENWEPLDTQKYDTTKLWHFKSAYK